MDKSAAIGWSLAAGGRVVAESLPGTTGAARRAGAGSPAPGGRCIVSSTASEPGWRPEGSQA